MIPGKKSKMHSTEDRKPRKILTIEAKVHFHVLFHRQISKGKSLTMYVYPELNFQFELNLNFSLSLAG